MNKQILNYGLLYLIVTFTMFFLGHIAGVERTAAVCQTMIEAKPTPTPRKVIPCDTDSDCLKKNGGDPYRVLEAK